MKTRSIIRIAPLLLAAALVVGCGSSSGGQISPSSGNPTGNPAARITSLVLSPKVVSKKVGESQQFTAVALYDNGTSLDVTSTSQWSSSNVSVVSIGSNTGLATSLLPGQVTITAQSAGFSDTAIVNVAGTTRLSLDSQGVQGNNGSENVSSSGDGRWMAFNSSATNLVAGDTNGAEDIFVRDRQTLTTTRVSVDSAGNQGNARSVTPSLSSDGRFVAFVSSATNLAPGDTNASFDVFVHDRQTSITTRVSVDSAGNQGNASSANPSISADGRFVSFQSQADNLVPGDTNASLDVFVHDRQSGTTVLVSRDSAGNLGNRESLLPSISADGVLIAFMSGATNLVAGDTNNRSDVFVHNQQTGTTTRMSVNSAGVQTDWNNESPCISGNGRFVGFASTATNLDPADTTMALDVYVHDRQTGETTLVSLDSAGVKGNLFSFDPRLSFDGRFVAFESDSTNLVAGDTNGANDIFLRDRQTGTTTRVNLNSSGAQANGTSSRASLSADGLIVSFSSGATNLVTDDTNGSTDVFAASR
jgi:hypothetical protein